MDIHYVQDTEQSNGGGKGMQIGIIQGLCISERDSGINLIDLRLTQTISSHGPLDWLHLKLFTLGSCSTVLF